MVVPNLIFSLRGMFPIAVATLLLAFATSGRAQDESPNAGISESELQNLVEESKANQTDTSPVERPQLGGISFLKLLVAGGALMIPIGLMSLLVVTISLERWFAVRRGRVFPRRLRREILRVANGEADVSPSDLYRVSELFPSPAGRILSDTLAKVGRPIPEIEAAVSEGIQREVDKLHGNVRWLTLAGAVTPLIGLLGTVWGLIIAFYDTTQLAAGTNRAASLAEGIYVALVTTMAGISVAIPAMFLAYYFEGRIAKTLALVENELRRLIPRFEAFEGRTRFDITSQGISQRNVSSPNIASGISEVTSSTSRGPKLKL